MSDKNSDEMNISGPWSEILKIGVISLNGVSVKYRHITRRRVHPLWIDCIKKMDLNVLFLFAETGKMHSLR